MVFGCGLTVCLGRVFFIGVYAEIMLMLTDRYLGRPHSCRSVPRHALQATTVYAANESVLAVLCSRNFTQISQPVIVSLAVTVVEFGRPIAVYEHPYQPVRSVDFSAQPDI